MSDHIKILFGDFLNLKQMPIAILSGHTSYISCLMIHKNKLYSGSNDNTIRIWNTETNEEITILRGHVEHVYNLIIRENKLYSKSFDRTTRVWNIETYDILEILYSDIDYIKNIKCYDNCVYHLVNETIHVWNKKTKQIWYLKGHNDHINNFTIHKNKLYSGGYDKNICIWNL